MPNKCESCKSYLPLSNGRFNEGKCMNLTVRDTTSTFYRGFMKINDARDICDRESNGIFVYFEAKTPTAGATFDDGGWPECPDCTHSIHPNEEHRCQTLPRAISAAAGGII